MTPAIKRIFERLDREAMSLCPEDRQHLWALLTALRGPDSADVILKKEVTEIVRANTLPWLTRDIGANCGFPGATIPINYRGFRRGWIPLVEEWHFKVHAQQAAEALDAN